MKSNRILVSVVVLVIVTAMVGFLYLPNLFWVSRGSEETVTTATNLGLAEVFDGRPKMPVSTSVISSDQVAGFLAQPPDGKYPAIIMIHEWWGLNDQIKSMAHILAGEGYVVFAVDLFEGNVATTSEEARENIAKNPNEKTIPRMQAALRYLKTLPTVDSSRIGVLGWCYGGGQSFLLVVNEDLQTAVVFYGQISTDPTVLKGLEEPVLGIFGADDHSIPVSTVRAFESALKGMGTEVEVYIYEGAGHAFANPTNSQAFRKDQAVDAWAKTLDFLERTLKES